MYTMKDEVLSEKKLGTLPSYLDLSIGKRFLSDVPQEIMFRDT